jgi:RHS repeat-associated protein
VGLLNEGILEMSKNSVSSYSLSPYGETQIFNATGTDITATGSAISNTYFFQGRHLDSESGFYYFRNRYYSPDLGRFISRDPIGYAAGDINLYRFVGNGPYGGLDPWGLEKVKLPYGNGYKCYNRTQDPDYKNVPNGCGSDQGIYDPPNDPQIILWGPRVSFKPACDSHDGCYGVCGASKQLCDDKFLKDMKAECDKAISNPILKQKCYQNAESYAWAVRGWGDNAFNTAQDLACEYEEVSCCD